MFHSVLRMGPAKRAGGRGAVVGAMLMVACATFGHADPVLLATKHFGGGGSSSAVPSPSMITQVSIELGYDGALDGAVCSRPRIGCTPIPVQNLVPGAIFDYDLANSPFFAHVASLLTDGQNQILWTIRRTHGPTGPLPLAGGGGTPDFTVFRRDADLIGKDIALIRLRVNAFEVRVGCCGSAEYSIDGTWEFYRDDMPTASQRMTLARLKAIYR